MATLLDSDGRVHPYDVGEGTDLGHALLELLRDGAKVSLKFEDGLFLAARTAANGIDFLSNGSDISLTRAVKGLLP